MVDYHQQFLRLQAQTSPEPLGLDIVEASGIYLTDRSGKQYMDLISGLAVTNVGHCHPRIVKVVQQQAARFMHVMPYGDFIQQPQVELAMELQKNLPRSIDSFYFVNSGTEATEGALKLAKRYTGRTEIITCHGAYHGSTHGSLSVSGNEKKKYAFRPLLPDVNFMRFNEPTDLEMITDKSAAVIIETVQGDAGVRIPSGEYMTKLRERCTITGAQLILDEIQTGFGRTGKLFAFEHYGIEPDILILAKAMGGGMPIGAFASSREKMLTLSHDPPLGHITTFGGHPVSCAAALENLRIITDENLVAAVESKGQLFEDLLVHPRIQDFRRIGLMMAVEFEDPETVRKIVHKCLDSGVVCFWFLSADKSFRLAPPLIITEEEIKKACQIILEATEAA